MARFASTIDNQPIYATRALNDKDGNQIDTTYAKLSDIPNVPVQDVTVDGTSVVNAQGVAEITTPTFTQAQADWTQSDQADPSYIQHKPNLAAVATSGDYSDLSNTPSIPTATSDLQNDSGFITSADIPVTDVEVDGVSVVSGGVASITMPSVPVTDVTVNGTSVVSSGVAAVTVPTATSDLTNDSNFITASEAPVQDVTVNGTSVLSNGVAAVTVPTATSDLTNDSGFITSSDIPAQQQADWTQADTSAPSYIAHKPNLAAVATSGDYSDLSNTPTIPTVDQTYNAASTNAQSGTAVAQAIAAIPSYTAGDGIDIAANEVSVKVGNGLEIGNVATVIEGSQTVQRLGSEGSYSYYMYYLQLNADLVDAIENGGLTVTLDPNFECSSSVFPVIIDSGYSVYNSGIFFGATSAAVSPGAVLNISLSDRNETYSELDFNKVKSNPTSYYLAFGAANQYVKYVLQGRTPSTVTSITTEYSYTKAVTNAVNVSNPLPASTSADEGKVLKVDANGDPEWATGGGGTQVQSNWLEDDTTDPSYIENKPTPKTLVAGQGIAISESSASLTVTNTVARDAVNLIAGQGVTLTQSGSDLTISSAGTTYTAGTGIDITNDEISLEAPVDLVAGPGITVDNPDGNTLRVSLAADPYNETVLWNQPTFASNLSGSVTLSETVKNFSKLMITFVIETSSYSYTTPTTKVFDMEALAALNNYTVTLDTQFIASDNNLICRSSKVTMNGTTFSETMSKQWYSGGVSTMSNPLHIIRVVGINRIANN